MRGAPTLEAILTSAEGRANPQKLKQVRRFFGIAFGSLDLSQPVDDPMILRRRLIEQMRKESVSAGTVQALVQFFMGIIRRAALAGLIPAPPEGPWTRTWQSVLDLAEETSGAKAHVRSLAAWATDKGLEPQHLGNGHFKDWIEDLKLDENRVAAAREVLDRWTTRPTPAVVASDPTRGERLRRKAAHGSVNGE